MSEPLSNPVEAALVVLIPEVEPLVGPFRMKYDSSAIQGMPAHITVNYPFLPGFHPNEDLYRELKELFARAGAFRSTFHRFARFSNVLYLAPDSETPFNQLIDLVAERFPESPPYGGGFDEIIPHLTIAHSKDEDLLRSVEKELAVLAQEFFPLSIKIERVWLMDKRGGRWQQVNSYQLGSG